MPAPAMVGSACGRALRRSLPAIAIAAAASAGVAAIVVGYAFITTSDRFAITDVQIRGEHHRSEQALRGELAIAAGDNVFAVDLDRARAALLADPWIATAEIHRQLPHAVIVEVSEREPVAVVDIDSGSGGLYLVDADGHAFKRAEIDRGEGADLPVVTGITRERYLADPDAAATTIHGALAELASWQSSAARPAIGEVHVNAHGAITLHTYDGATAIQLGEPDAGASERIATFDLAWADLDAGEKRRARAIHLDTLPDHITVAFAQD